MKKREISQYRLLKLGVDNKTLNTLKNNGNITVRTLETICRILQCQANDVVAFVDEEQENKLPEAAAPKAVLRKKM